MSRSVASPLGAHRREIARKAEARQPACGKAPTRRHEGIAGMSEEINRFGAEQPAVIKTRQGLFGAPDQGDTTGFSQQVTVARTAPAAVRPYGSYSDQIVDILEELIAADGLAVADVIEKVVVEHGELSIFISREHIRRVVRYLRDDQDLRFEMCLGTNGVNYPRRSGP